MEKEFLIYEGFIIDIHPNGDYYVAFAVNKEDKFFGAFAKEQEEVIAKNHD